MLSFWLSPLFFKRRHLYDRVLGLWTKAHCPFFGLFAFFTGPYEVLHFLPVTVGVSGFSSEQSGLY